MLSVLTTHFPFSFDKIPSQKQLKGERVPFMSQFGGTVVNGGTEVILVRMGGGSWVHCLCSQEAESNNVMLSSPFPFYSVGGSPH